MIQTPLLRRGLRRSAAATYIGVGETTFDKMVREGLMPKPKRIAGCVVWDVRQLDLAFDALTDEPQEVDTWEGV